MQACIAESPIDIHFTYFSAKNHFNRNNVLQFCVGLKERFLIHTSSKSNALMEKLALASRYKSTGSKNLTSAVWDIPLTSGVLGYGFLGT